ISRLARNNADVQQLLQICGLNQTLLSDADAVYALTHLNDRLVLGLKGTMSEAQLFTMRARLQAACAPRRPGVHWPPSCRLVVSMPQQVRSSSIRISKYRKRGAGFSK